MYTGVFDTTYNGLINVYLFELRMLEVNHQSTQGSRSKRPLADIHEHMYQPINQVCTRIARMH
jgi:hypothetical protein